MILKNIYINNVSFEKGKTVIVNEPNKMWEDDVITSSSKISYSMKDGTHHGCFVKADNIDDAIKEIIPVICYEELVGTNLTFEDIGLPNPKYETYDDGDGYITSINEFNNLLNADIHLVDKDRVLSCLRIKSCEMFKVVVCDA